jgi:hypothetical protein
MRPFLMYRDRDFDLKQDLPCEAPLLDQDLELGTLFNAMADGDEYLLDIVRKAVFSGLENDRDTILYRQAALDDCLTNPDVVRAVYGLAVEAIEAKRNQRLGIFSHNPGAILQGAVKLMTLFTGLLERLRNTARENADQFRSDAFRTLFTTLIEELDDEYLAGVKDHLKHLRFPHGVLMSAELGRGNEGRNYILRRSRERGWTQRLLAMRQPSYSFSIHPRDEAGGRALWELRDRGVNLAANALAQSADHILSFFQLLRAELAFYVGCLNLQTRLAGKGESICFPDVFPVGERRHHATGLYDVCLSLAMDGSVVGNTVDADAKSLVMITGANQGGKSTFLRSVGLAQLMMQCGLFVGAESFGAELCAGLFTHYKREEDAAMESGKFDEEMSRMSDIAEAIRPGSMILFNESFAATNEREGSEIARQIVLALIDEGVKVFFVTHLFDLAHGLFEKGRNDALFLRAERRTDGTRTFRVVPGEPLETSYGEDLYRRVFADAAGRHVPASAGERPD